MVNTQAEFHDKVYRQIHDQLYITRSCLDEKQFVVISSEEGFSLLVEAWISNKGFVHFRRLAGKRFEYYGFTKKREMIYEGKFAD